MVIGTQDHLDEALIAENWTTSGIVTVTSYTAGVLQQTKVIPPQSGELLVIPYGPMLEVASFEIEVTFPSGGPAPGDYVRLVQKEFIDPGLGDNSHETVLDVSGSLVGHPIIRTTVFGNNPLVTGGQCGDRDYCAGLPYIIEIHPDSVATAMGDWSCTGNPNSLGATAIVRAKGSYAAADNDLTLTASNVPPGRFGFFLTSQTYASGIIPPGSQGVLCLTSPVGRLNGPGQVLQADSTGSFSVTLDLTQHPTGSGQVAVNTGDHWGFQAWFRDQNPGSTSNFSDMTAITFH